MKFFKIFFIAACILACVLAHPSGRGSANKNQGSAGHSGNPDHSGRTKIDREFQAKVSVFDCIKLKVDCKKHVDKHH